MDQSTRATAYIGIGSNISKPCAQIRQAIFAIDNLANTQLLGLSRRFISKAIGPQQPDYINAVAAINTGLQPTALLASLQAIETAQNRTRELRWGPRTIDLDILLYDGYTSTSDALTIPHPEMNLRTFVLLPLTDLAPGLALPMGSTAAALLNELPRPLPTPLDAKPQQTSGL